MTILDIVILALMVLAAVWGLIRGGKRKLVKLIGLVGGLVIAVLFFSMLGSWICSLCGDSLARTMADKVLSSAEGDALIVLSAPYDAVNGFKQAFTAAGIPSFFASFFATKVFISDSTAAVAVGSAFAAAIIYAACFVGLFLITFIILTILARLLLRMGGDGDKKTILDRILGLVFSEGRLVLSLIVIMLILVGLSYAIPSLDTWLTEQTKFNSGTVGLSGWFYSIAWQIINAFRALFI